MKLRTFVPLVSILCLSISCFFGCRTAFELARGKSFNSTNSSTTNLCKGVVPIEKIDPNFVRLRISTIDADMYPDSIQIHILLTDDRGNFIPNMAPPYNHLNDWKEHWNEVMEKYGEEFLTKRMISEYSVREVNNIDRPPIALALVLDYSGAMKGKTVEMEYASETVSLLKRDVDEMAIMKYDDLPVTEVHLTKDRKEILDKNKRDGLARFGGKRAVFSACLEAIKILKDASGVKNIILFTSGNDNVSKVTMHEVIQTARDSNIKLFVIATGDADTVMFSKMGQYTKGKFIYTPEIGEAEGYMEDIYRSLINYYVLSYKPPLNYRVHEVHVQAIMPDASLEAKTSELYDREFFDSYAPVGIAMPFMIEFEFNRSDIKEESFKAIDKVAASLKEIPSLKIEIRGHTDIVGKEDYNKLLSEQRANAIKNYLVKNGIDENRITVVSYGSTKPVAPNDTEVNRQLNRRTEFVILSR